MTSRRERHELRWSPSGLGHELERSSDGLACGLGPTPERVLQALEREVVCEQRPLPRLFRELSPLGRASGRTVQLPQHALDLPEQYEYVRTRALVAEFTCSAEQVNECRSRPLEIVRPPPVDRRLGERLGNDAPVVGH